MKKIILTSVIILTIGLSTIAQNTKKDGFFSDWYYSNNRTNVNDFDLPTLPNNHGYYDDQPASLGSGLLIMATFGAGYALIKRKNRDKK